MLNRIFLKIDQPIIDALLLIISFLIGLISSKLIRLPLVKTYDIASVDIVNGFNPETNYLRVLWIIFFTISCFFILKYLQSKNQIILRILIALFLIFGVLTMNMLPEIDTFQHNLDTFHHGEQLSPANAFINGKKPYSEIFVLHGMGEDILLPALALNLPFTPNDGGIGSYLFVEICLAMLSGFIFLLILAKFLKPLSLYLLASLWFTLSYYSVFYYIRDTLIWIILLLAWYILIKPLTAKKEIILFTCLGIASSIWVFFALDRGIIAISLSMILATILLFFKKKKDRWRLARNIRQINIKPFVFLFAGIIFVNLVALIILGKTQFTAYVKMSYIDIPKYQGLLFDYPLPDIKLESYFIYLPLIIATIVVIMFIYMFFNEYKNKRYSSELLLSFFLIVSSLIFLRAGYGRSDIGHIAYCTPILFLTTFYVSYVFVKKNCLSKHELLWLPILFFTLLAFPNPTITIERITSLANARPERIKQLLKLPATSNSIWIPQKVNAVTEYIKNNTSQNDKLFVFTQQPIYYYLTDRTNPTRFYITWFADPNKLEHEMLNSLKQNPPAVVIYSSSTSWDNVDGSSMKQRTPSVDTWIKTNYPKITTISGVEIRQK